MKTILIATDFSTSSRNASLYGVELAGLLDAKIVLFSAYHVPHPLPGLNVNTSIYGVMKETEQKLQDEVPVIMKDKNIIIETTCDEGPPEAAIMNIAKEKDADFIITGMKGSGNNLKKVFGSTTTVVAKNTNIPVVIVPEDAKFTKPATIAFASDINLDTDTDSLNQLIAFTQLFNSKVYIAKVVKADNKGRPEVSATPHKLLKAIKGLDASFEYLIDHDITHALNEFIKKHDVDLLVMMPHKHEWMERLFKKSETKNMIFHTHIPLLILPEKVLLP